MTHQFAVNLSHSRNSGPAFGSRLLRMGGDGLPADPSPSCNLFREPPAGTMAFVKCSVACVVTALAVAGWVGAVVLHPGAAASPRQRGSLAGAGGQHARTLMEAGGRGAAMETSENHGPGTFGETATSEPDALGQRTAASLTARPPLQGKARVVGDDSGTVDHPNDPLELGIKSGATWASAGPDAEAPSHARPRISAISREDEAYRSKYGYAAYNQLLQERHRSAMEGAAGTFPAATSPGGETTATATVGSPFSAADSVDNGAGVSGSGLVAPTGDLGPDPTPGYHGTGSTDSGLPSWAGIPLPVILPPVLTLKNSGDAYVLEAGVRSGVAWRVEHSESLPSGNWIDVGPLGGTNRWVVTRDATVASGFWRLRSGSR